MLINIMIVVITVTDSNSNNTNSKISRIVMTIRLSTSPASLVRCQLFTVDVCIRLAFSLAMATALFQGCPETEGPTPVGHPFPCSWFSAEAEASLTKLPEGLVYQKGF